MKICAIILTSNIDEEKMLGVSYGSGNSLIEGK
jgi:hypothetical protein